MRGQGRSKTGKSAIAEKMLEVISNEVGQRSAEAEIQRKRKEKTFGSEACKGVSQEKTIQIIYFCSTQNILSVIKHDDICSIVKFTKIRSFHF